MNISNALKTAVRSLGKNRLRSALTSIGIIIGISSVIVMMGLGNSARLAVRDMVFTYGDDAFRVRESGYSLSATDIHNLRREIPEINYISPVFRSSNEEIRHKNKRHTGFIFGGNMDFIPMMGRYVIDGRSFTQTDIDTTARVIIIGQTLANELFDGRSPIGELVVAGGVPMQIIGILNRAGEGFSGDDYDTYAIIPFTTAQTRIWNRAGFRDMYVSAHSPDEISYTSEQVRNYLRRKHNLREGQEDTFEIHKSEDKLQIADEISQALAILLAGIASISLFVGGVGIMNIMLVSVTERTREIGIRMAIGAKRRDIMMQFLIESATLSSAGGIIGISIGLGIYYVVVDFVEWPFIFSLPSIMLAAIFAAAVGLFFGYYPSRKAAALKPIEALKYE